MNYNSEFFLPSGLLDVQEPQLGNLPPPGLNQVSQPDKNLLGISLPYQTHLQKKLREQRQKRPQNLQEVLQPIKTQPNFANNASQPHNKSNSTPPRGNTDQTSEHSATSTSKIQDIIDNLHKCIRGVNPETSSRSEFTIDNVKTIPKQKQHQKTRRMSISLDEQNP